MTGIDRTFPMPESMQDLMTLWFDLGVSRISEHSGDLVGDSVRAHRIAALFAVEHDLEPPDVPEWLSDYLRYNTVD